MKRLTVNDGLQAVAQAIMDYEKWGDHKGHTTHDIAARFVDVALMHDLTLEFTGRAGTGIGPDSTLLELFYVLTPKTPGSNARVYANYVALKLSHWLKRKVTLETKLRDIWNPNESYGFPPQESASPQLRV